MKRSSAPNSFQPISGHREERFSFNVRDATYRIVFQKQDEDTAFLYFVNKFGKITPIPNKAEVTDVSDDSDDEVNVIGNTYVIHWSHSYIVSFDGIPMIRIVNERHQVIFITDQVRVGY